MSWLVPSALAVAGVTVLAGIALHFIARSRPLAEALPTTRFIPRRPVHARTRSLALTDLALLLLRLTAIVALGIAVAAPMLPSRGRVVRVIAADRSADVASITEVRDSVRRYLRAGDLLVAFDSVAARGEVASLNASTAGGSLSAALAGAIRLASQSASRADSLDLVLVSPFTAAERDAATMRIRDSWPGRIAVVRVAAAKPVVRPSVEVEAPAGDPVAAGIALAGLNGPKASVRIVRGMFSSADSAWASVDGHVLVHWPSDLADATWTRRSSIDAVGAVSSATGTMVSRFPRPWILAGRPIARWVDGEPAAVQLRIGEACIRDVGVLLDDASDLTLRAPFRAFVRALAAPCDGIRGERPLAADSVNAIAGSGPLAPGSAFLSSGASSSRWTPWLLLVAALLLLAELRVRRTERRHA